MKRSILLALAATVGVCFCAPANHETPITINKKEVNPISLITPEIQGNVVTGLGDALSFVSCFSSLLPEPFQKIAEIGDAFAFDRLAETVDEINDKMDMTLRGINDVKKSLAAIEAELSNIQSELKSIEELIKQGNKEITLWTTINSFQSQYQPFASSIGEAFSFISNLNGNPNSYPEDEWSNMVKNQFLAYYNPRKTTSSLFDEWINYVDALTGENALDTTYRTPSSIFHHLLMVLDYDSPSIHRYYEQYVSMLLKSAASGIYIFQIAMNFLLESDEYQNDGYLNIIYDMNRLHDGANLLLHSLEEERENLYTKVETTGISIYGTSSPQDYIINFKNGVASSYSSKEGHQLGKMTANIDRSIILEPLETFPLKVFDAKGTLINEPIINVSSSDNRVAIYSKRTGTITGGMPGSATITIQNGSETISVLVTIACSNDARNVAFSSRSAIIGGTLSLSDTYLLTSISELTDISNVDKYSWNVSGNALLVGTEVLATKPGTLVLYGSLNETVKTKYDSYNRMTVLMFTINLGENLTQLNGEVRSPLDILSVISSATTSNKVYEINLVADLLNKGQWSDYASRLQSADFSSLATKSISFHLKGNGHTIDTHGASFLPKGIALTAAEDFTCLISEDGTHSLFGDQKIATTANHNFYQNITISRFPEVTLTPATLIDSSGLLASTLEVTSGDFSISNISLKGRFAIDATNYSTTSGITSYAAGGLFGSVLGSTASNISVSGLLATGKITLKGTGVSPAPTAFGSLFGKLGGGFNQAIDGLSSEADLKVENGTPMVGGLIGDYVAPRNAPTLSEMANSGSISLTSDTVNQKVAGIFNESDVKGIWSFCKNFYSTGAITSVKPTTYTSAIVNIFDPNSSFIGSSAYLSIKGSFAGETGANKFAYAEHTSQIFDKDANRANNIALEANDYATQGNESGVSGTTYLFRSSSTTTYKAALEALHDTYPISDYISATNDSLTYDLLSKIKSFETVINVYDASGVKVATGQKTFAPFSEVSLKEMLDGIYTIPEGTQALFYRLGKDSIYRSSELSMHPTPKTKTLDIQLALQVSGVEVKGIEGITKVYDGESSTLSMEFATLYENAEYTYQWFQMDNTGVYAPIEGGNSKSLTVKEIEDSGTYRCELTATKSGVSRTYVVSGIDVLITAAPLTVIVDDPNGDSFLIKNLAMANLALTVILIGGLVAFVTCDWLLKKKKNVNE